MFWIKPFFLKSVFGGVFGGVLGVFWDVFGGVFGGVLEAFLPYFGGSLGGKHKGHIKEKHRITTLIHFSILLSLLIGLCGYR